MSKTAILCVDDEDIVLSSLKRQLRRHLGGDILIEVAQDGEEALDIVEELMSEEICLAVVISDYIMPKMKGDELLKRIYALLPATLTILLTGQASMEGVANAVNEANLYRYIAKPWEQTDLLLTVTEAVRKYNQERMLAEHNVALQLANRRLEQLNTNLETQVDRRTAELRSAYQHLKALHDRMEDELLLARQIQQGLLPASRFQSSNLDIACYSVPAHELGGDFYCYYPLERERFAVMVGDVSGKGVSAALLMALSLAHLDIALSQPLTPSERLIYLDRSIARYTRSRIQNCALCYVEFEMQSQGEVVASIVNAGCIPPYIRRRNGTVECPEVVGCALGHSLGMVQGYEEVKVALSPGDQVILTSDGVVEARNMHGHMLGFESLEQMINSNSSRDAPQMLSYLVARVEHFMGNAELADDLTVIVVQIL